MLAIVGATVAVTLGLYIIPFPHQFSFTVVPVRPGLGYEFNPPSGAAVQGSWSAVHGIMIGFVVQSSLNDRVYWSFSTSGSFAFTATAPPYYLYVTSSSVDDVNVSGSYYTPIL
jgi:hypothetical protein